MFPFYFRFGDLASRAGLSVATDVLGRDVDQWHDLKPSRATLLGLPVRLVKWAAPVLVVFAFAELFGFLRWCVS